MRFPRSASVFLRLAIATFVAIGFMSVEAQAATPSRPASCNVSIVNNQPVLTWSASSFDGSYGARYQVWRNGGVRAGVDSGHTSFADGRVAFSTVYHYSVLAKNDSGATVRTYCGSVTSPSYTDINGGTTTPVTPVTPVDPIDPVDPVDPIDPVDPVDPVDPGPVDPLEPIADPVAPSSCSLSEILRKEVQVDWTGGSGDFFIIRRNGVWRARVESGTTFEDLRSQHGQNYTYTVEARTDDGQVSSATSCGSIDTPPTGFSWTPPVAPEDCSVSRNADGSIQVNWDADASAEFYVVRRNGGWNGRVDAPSTTYLDNRLAAGTTYSYTVESRSDEGISDRTDCGSLVA